MELQCSFGDPDYLKLVILKDILGVNWPQVTISETTCTVFSCFFFYKLYFFCSWKRWTGKARQQSEISNHSRMLRRRMKHAYIGIDKYHHVFLKQGLSLWLSGGKKLSSSGNEICQWVKLLLAICAQTNRLYRYFCSSGLSAKKQQKWTADWWPALWDSVTKIKLR